MRSHLIPAFFCISPLLLARTAPKPIRRVFSCKTCTRHSSMVRHACFAFCFFSFQLSDVHRCLSHPCRLFLFLFTPVSFSSLVCFSLIPIKLLFLLNKKKKKKKEGNRREILTNQPNSRQEWFSFFKTRKQCYQVFQNRQKSSNNVGWSL